MCAVQASLPVTEKGSTNGEAAGDGLDENVRAHVHGRVSFRAVRGSGTGLFVPRAQVLNVSGVPHRDSYAAYTHPGVFKSTDNGGTWNSLNTGLPNTNVFGLAIDPTMPGTLYAGTGGGVFDIEQVSACVGDCEGTGTVALDDLVTLVNIALGTTQPEAYANGLPIGGEVPIAVIIQAVNHALHGCGG
jgi:hypothetical protein